MIAAQGRRAARSRRAGFFAGLAASIALAPGLAAAQAPLFAFAQFSDVQAAAPEHFARFAQVLAAIAAAGQPGALLPHPVAAVFIAGDHVDEADTEAEWIQYAQSLQTELTGHGIPFLAVPGNHDQDEFGTPFYEQYLASAGVWDVSSVALNGHNGLTTATGWAGLRFVGLNNSHNGWNTVSTADRAQALAIAAAADAAGENVFLLAHHPHDDLGPVPLADVLEVPGVVGYLRGHGGLPHATQGLAGVANPVWDLSSESVARDAALLYYEVYPAEIRVYVLTLVTNPLVLPAPAVLTLPHPLAPAPAATAPAAAFSASPPGGRAPREVAFADLSAGEPSSWLWDFGDGSTSTARHPIHTYLDGGSYDVSLVATNAQGVDAETQFGAVELLPPLASTTFLASADARVSSANPTLNYGSEQSFRARFFATASEQSYLRFDVSGLEDLRITRAVLRFYVTNPSVEGGSIRSAPAGWSESTLTWENAPGMGAAVLAEAGWVFPDTWVEFDVSSEVKAAGSHYFGLTSDSSNTVVYSSRENSHPPELVVTTAPAVPALGPAATALLAALLATAGARTLGARGRSHANSSSQRRSETLKPAALRWPPPP